MKYHREFEIGWYGLALGEHHFEYQVNKRIIEDLGYELDEVFDTLQATVKLKFDKKSSFFILNFDIDGIVTVPCDRCGEDFELKLWDEFSLIIKLTGEVNNDTHSEDSDEGDVVFIPRSETVLNVFEWVYEFVMLSIPIQHIHPLNENEEPTCNPKIIALLNQLSVTEEELEKRKESTDEADKKNIWKDLDKFKFS